MGGLKPIGSEKLTGQEKLKRIMEIATYRDAKPVTQKDLETKEYSIGLSDGNEYQIVKEKMGYIIKKTITESETDYIEPMKNRKYFPSYSQALKKLNLMAKEINRLTETEEGTSLFGEQKKFVLKTPKPAAPEMELPTPPAEPPSVPAPELPPSDTAEPVDSGEEMPVDAEVDVDIEKTDVGDVPDMGALDSEPVTFKSIQKLTGKLTQKIREFETEEGLTSEDMKYVINMVLSSLDLKNLSEEDKEDILSKFESEEEDFGSEEDLGSTEEDIPADEDITSDTEVEKIQGAMDIPVESQFDETYSHLNVGESKVDKVISKYFEISESEKKQLQEKNDEMRLKRKSEFTKKMESVKKLSESIEQELASQKFLEENTSFVFLGKTNKKNLVFEKDSEQVKISPEGFVL